MPMIPDGVQLKRWDRPLRGSTRLSSPEIAGHPSASLLFVGSKPAPAPLLRSHCSLCPVLNVRWSEGLILTHVSASRHVIRSRRSAPETDS